MRRDAIDFFHVEPHHLPIHDRLLEWGRAQNNTPRSSAAPMFAGFESSASAKMQRETPRPPVDVASVAKTNEHIRALGERHRKAVHWFYSLNKPPAFGMRYINCTKPELLSLVVDARQLLTISLRRDGVRL